MKALSEQYPVWFCDVWGVIHNGHDWFRPAVEALLAHRMRGGIVVLLTNSPRSHAGVERQLIEIGIDASAWDAIVTSGDVTRTLMVENSNGKLFHIGPSRDMSLFVGLDVERVELEDASAVICTGLNHELVETPEDYRWLLVDARDRGLPFICANPDLVVRKGSKLLYCAGSLAELHTKIGGKVLMAGKPFTPIYDLAMRRSSAVAKREITRPNVLAIGDGIGTDIKGAAGFGIAAVMIAGGINEADDDLSSIVRDQVPNAQIVATFESLSWV